MGLVSACGDGFKKESRLKRQQDALEVDSNPVNQEYMKLVNEHRRRLGLHALKFSSGIEAVAKQHSKAMALGSRPFGHMGFSVRCRWIKNRLGPHMKCAEIVAKGQKTPQRVLSSWINSLDHRSELEDPYYTHTALGIYTSDKGVTYWTQMFVELE